MKWHLSLYSTNKYNSDGTDERFYFYLNLVEHINGESKFPNAVRIDFTFFFKRKWMHILQNESYLKFEKLCFEVTN